MKFPAENIRLRAAAESGDSSARPEIYDCGLINLKDWNSKGSFGSFWHIYWNSRSGASVSFNGARFDFKPSRAYLIPAHTQFSAALSNELKHFYIDFSIHGRFENLRHGVYEFSPCYIKQMLPPFITAGDAETRTTIVNSIIWRFLAALPPDAFAAPEKRKLDSRVARAIEIMENNIGMVNDVSTVCRRVGMSPNSFYLLFKRETNKTPLTFLMQLRLNRACFLLMNTDKNIDEIASELGFADRYHFSKCFKKRCGFTPVKYKIFQSSG